MFFFCECLNIIGQISDSSTGLNGSKIIASGAMSDVACYEALEFLKLATGPVKGNVSVQHEALIRNQKIGKWIVKHCLNCDSFVYATGDGINQEMLWVNPSLIRNQDQLQIMRKCDKYSMPFKVILKPLDGLPQPKQMNENLRIKTLYGTLQDFIEADAAKTQAEIGRLTMEMNARRQRAQKDFERIAALIESTKTLSTENIELTPPVTPESINDKSVDNHLQLPQTNSIKIGNKGSTKRVNAINTLQAREFNEDIFEFDGMIQDDHHSNFVQLEAEDSDNDDGIDKRGANRARSGSINIARSAPISMPQFIHHAIQEINAEEKPTAEQQMDIASSIQMLARSIHADSIFGEMPARPVLRYNTEF